MSGPFRGAPLDWRFGAGQTYRQERAEIERAQIEGRAEAYTVAQAATRADEPTKAKRRRATTARTPVPLPVFSPDPRRLNNGLLADHAKGLLPPVPIALPDEVPTWARPVAEFVALVIGLRLTVGEARPSPFGQEWVAGYVGCSPATASRALGKLADIGFTTVEAPMPARGKPQGTAVYGIRGYTDAGGSDGLPDAKCESTAVTVEAERIGTNGATVEPTREAPDQARVRQAEVGASRLSAVPAAGHDADGSAVAIHHSTRYAARPTPALLLDRAIALDKPTRHQAYWLATQLRDNGYDEHGAAFDALCEFAARQSASFTTNQAVRALRAAYRRPARDPWAER